MSETVEYRCVACGHYGKVASCTKCGGHAVNVDEWKPLMNVPDLREMYRCAVLDRDAEREARHRAERERDVSDARLKIEEQTSFRGPLLAMQGLRDEAMAMVWKAERERDELARAARWLWELIEAEGLTNEIHDDDGCPQDDTCTCPTAVMLRIIPSVAP